MGIGQNSGHIRGVQGPRTTNHHRPHIVRRDSFSVSSLSPCRHRGTGQAGLGSDWSFLCPEWVPVLPAFPAGDSAAIPVPGFVGSPVDAPAQGGGRGFPEQGVEPGVEQRSH